MPSAPHHDSWIAHRMRSIDASGIRKVFELARDLKDPVNLSIGLPDFDVPEPVKAAAGAAATVHGRDCLPEMARLAQEKRVRVRSDEVYRVLCYDEPCTRPAEFSEDVLGFGGFSKSDAMTGWRLGFAHGPRRLVQEMMK